MVGRKRHIAKTITWRLVASATTFCLAWLFFRDDPQVATKAGGIAAIEIILKMLLYYIHERTWYRSNFGIKK